MCLLTRITLHNCIHYWQLHNSVCVCGCVCMVTAYTTRKHHVVDGVKTGFSAQVEDLSCLESQGEFVNPVLHM